MTTVCVQVFTQQLQVVIRNPSHKIPSCDLSPLLIFSTIGEDNVCGEVDCVKVYIDGIRVQVKRIGDAYGYDYYGADNRPFGYVPDNWQFPGTGYGDPYGYGYGYAYGYQCRPNYDPTDPYGYGYDDGYGYDGIPGTTDDTYGSDALPGTLHIFQLPELTEGRHTVRVVVKGTSGLEAEATETFIVDASGPIVNITSPIDDTINPVTEIPVLRYEITDFTGLLSVNVNIDGEDKGWLPSGTVLSELKSGLHTIEITAYDMATNECPMGNSGQANVQFNLLKPIEINEIPRLMYIGTDADRSGSGIVDAVIEELRILNKMSTDANVLDEFKILRERIRFQLREGNAVLSADEVLRLIQVDADSGRINLPEQTLILSHYDNTINSESGIGDLKNPTNQIIDPLVAGRRIDVTIYYKEGEVIDKELIRELINRVIPAFVEASIVFEEVQE